MVSLWLLSSFKQKSSMLGENGELHPSTIMYWLLTTISEQTIAATEKYRDEWQDGGLAGKPTRPVGFCLAWPLLSKGV